MMTPRTIFGCTFSPQNALLLSTLKRCRGYKSNIWISSAVANRIRLKRYPKYNSSHFPVTLSATNKEHNFENIEEFEEEEDEILRRVRKVFPLIFSLFNSPKTAHKEALPVVKNSDVELSKGKYIPLDTNGEAFDTETVNHIALKYPYLQSERPYWVTEFEAKFVFQVDLKEKSKRSGPQFQVRRFGGHLLTYYHVSGTIHPELFNMETCVRYDPYNFFGIFYRPVTALAMKRYAIQHRCCSWKRWVCIHRVHLYNVNLLPRITPLSLVHSDEVVQLVNVGLTTNPKLLENLAVKKQHFSSIKDEALEKR